MHNNPLRHNGITEQAEIGLKIAPFQPEFY